MTNNEILEIALKQSAIDANCQMEDFLKCDNIIVESLKHEEARKYLELPHLCHLISYGSNIVATIDMRLKDIVEKYIHQGTIEHCFETPNLYKLNKELEEYEARVCFMAEYFLPDMNVLKDIECSYETKILKQEDFKDLYIKEWSNALSELRPHLDVLGVGAYDHDKLIALAACSADGNEMWQIGVDVLPEYRKQGIASSLTSKLALEIIKCGKVPFYCVAWSNVKSVRNAIKAGFKPTWVEMTVKTNEFIAKM